MLVAILNKSTLAKDDDVARTVAAIQKQVDHDLAPAWGARADLVFVKGSDTPPAEAWLVTLLDTCDGSDALGYHDWKGAPAGMVGVKSAIDDGSSWSSTLSHEVLELIVDPWAEICIQSGAQAVFLEICDPVEGQPYKIDDVEVEDFVLPDYYRPDSKGPWNFNKAAPLKGPLTLGPGGYTNTATLGDWKQQNADKVRRGKRAPSAWSRRGRRMRARK